MAVPLSYNIRNLIVRKTTTIMTALGVALTVAVLLSVLALVHGLKTALTSTGSPLQILVTRQGATSEAVSMITPPQFLELKVKPGVARDQDGQALASLEMLTIINLTSVDAPDGMNINLRGVSPQGLKIRDGLKIVNGRWFVPGRREVVVGESVAQRFPGARIGQKLHFGRGDWEVVGVMSAGQSATNSEIFGDLNQVSSDYQRSDALSSVLLTATDPVAADALIKDISGDQKLNLDAKYEKDYYAAQTSSAAPIQFMGTFVAIIMGIGSSFAAMNTMFAAVARRSREIGTLRVLGFSRGSILFSFFIESVILSGLGGLLGILLILPLNGLTTGIGNTVTFSETAFKLQVSVPIMIAGVGFAMLLGAFGGLLPARSAANKEILTALREI